MSVYVESQIEFDFSAASFSEKHDSVNPILGSVDFIVKDTSGQIWLEVKSWHPNRFEPYRRGGQRRSYLAKMKSKEFPLAMREKFSGTCAYLTLTGNPPAVPIRYVLLLESSPLDSALRMRLMDRMKELLRTNPKTTPWIHPVSVAVIDTAEWNARLPQYPARLV